MKNVIQDKLNAITYATVIANAVVVIAITALMWNTMGRFLDIGVIGRSIICVFSLLNLLYFKKSKICYGLASIPHFIFFILACLIWPLIPIAGGAATLNILSLVYLNKYIKN